MCNQDLLWRKGKLREIWWRWVLFSSIWPIALFVGCWDRSDIFPRNNQHCLFQVMICFGLQNSLNNITEAYMSFITPGHFRSLSHQACFLSQRVTTFIVPWFCLRALTAMEVHHNRCFQFIFHPLSISPYPHKWRGGFGETFESEATSAANRPLLCVVRVQCAFPVELFANRRLGVVSCWTESCMLCWWVLC